jgi:hypothetical protein
MNSNTITTYNKLDANVVRTIREAYDHAVLEIEQRRGIQAPPLGEDSRAKLAQCLVSLARQGECDPSRLRMAAMTSFPA